MEGSAPDSTTVCRFRNILVEADLYDKIIAQHLRVSAQIFPTRYSEHLGRVECLIYLPFLPLLEEVFLL
ncbi:hypothetical protein BHU09_05740 [Tannerella sp. oral taxon 808]|nr:hypothetical protein BHU09_05740 [Tannerella sp. oral taxon 808]